ncbi:MAG: IS481 family transposase, partial [candidate division WOR-3 bacterium]
RTLYEHLIEWNLKEIIQPDKFNYYLMNYLLWYNTQKPHQALNTFSPIEYFLKKYVKNNYYSNMYINRTYS